MRPLSELVDAEAPGWPLVQTWVGAAVRPLEVLERVPALADANLLKLQVTTRSSLGAVAHQCGGILIDGGWVRVLGSGCQRMTGSLASWNATDGEPPGPGMPGLLFVAHDVLGGFFALDGGALGEGRGGAFYFAPDTLRWEDLGGGYSQLLQLLLLGDLDAFYGSFRWPGWRESLSDVGPDHGFTLYPPPWTVEGKDLARVSRRPAPMRELLGWQMAAARQLGDGG